MSSNNWLTVIGLGEDGPSALSPAARTLIESAEVIVGGQRHLDMVQHCKNVERLLWRSPLSDTVVEIGKHVGKRVTVLATGDPMWFGIGVTLTRVFGRDSLTIIPAPGAFSLAAARIGWPLADVTCLTLHGRPLSLINLHICPDARLLVLSENGRTPSAVAKALVERGYGPSTLTVFEHMGGSSEAMCEATAESWSDNRCADINTIAIECRCAEYALVLSRLAGLPDNVYEHDGQLTKREVRALTLAALAPQPRHHLWDVGAGAGSVAIEWMRAGGQATAFEHNLDRVSTIARNAERLGVPSLSIVPGIAPATFRGVERPHAVFIGGGLSNPGVADACWEALESGGQIVANAVTIEGESELIRRQSALGGTLAQFAISHLEPQGRFNAWRARAPVTQWSAVKP
jgi:precorrin-6Y C5,15-methyltransferase (decarboxylating)